jgi:hypothetical protein
MKCMCGHKDCLHGPNWNNECPNKPATGFSVCYIEGCDCMAYCASPRATTFGSLSGGYAMAVDTEGSGI